MAAVVFALSIASTSSGLADPDPPYRWREVWAGSDISTDVWLLYSGVTVAPWSHIHGEGVRFRAASGYGQYRYSDALTSGGGAPAEFHARAHFADLLAGYQTRFGELTAKAFAGASIIGHDIQPFDDETLVTGSETGVKGVVELWLNMGQNAWGSLDLAWSSAHDTRSARMRAGYRILPTVSLGVEGGLNVDAQAECRIKDGANTGCRASYDARDAARLLDYGRGGLFLRYEWAGGEASVSAGALGGSFQGERASDVDPYVTFTWITQF